MSRRRTALVAAVAARIPVAVGADCVLVGIDGVDGSGKSFFADELAGELRARGREVVRASLDDWHHVRDLRYVRGRTSPVGFWLDSFDYPRALSELLSPLAPGGSREFRRRGHDLASDEVLHDPIEVAPPGSVVVVDGLFLQRAELQGAFGLVVWLDVAFEVTARRMSERDGTAPDPQAQSMARYVQAQRIYLTERDPRARADLVIDNTDLSAPVLVEGAIA